MLILFWHNNQQPATFIPAHFFRALKREGTGLDSFENASGRAGYFDITYHYPSTGHLLGTMGVGG